MISTYYKLVKKYLAYKLLYIAVRESKGNEQAHKKRRYISQISPPCTLGQLMHLNHSFSTKKDKHYYMRVGNAD